MVHSRQLFIRVLGAGREIPVVSALSVIVITERRVVIGRGTVRVQGIDGFGAIGRTRLRLVHVARGLWFGRVQLREVQIQLAGSLWRSVQWWGLVSW